MQLELKNSRFPDRELKENLLEIIRYSRYAGLNVEKFRKAISVAVLKPGPEGPGLRHGGRLILETDNETSNLINQLVRMYPVFSTWDINVTKPRKSSSTVKTSTKENQMAAKKKVAKKKVAKKKVVKKKVATKKVAKKKVVKKKVAKKKVAKKKVAKKKVAKKKVAKKKVAKKKVAKKKVAKKKTAKKKK